MKIFREILSPLIAVIAAFVVGGLLVLLIGDNPFQTFALLVGNSFGSLNDIGYTLFIATPLIFTGLAVAVAFRCGLLNIGAEGQLYVAAFVTAWVGIKFGGTVVNVFGENVDYSWTSLPAILLVPLCILAAIVAGGIWGAIPGFLKAKFGSHEVINTIMLNFVGIALVSYFTQYHYKQAGDPILQTVPIGEAAHIPRISQFIPGMPDFVPLSVAFLIAILMCVLVYIFLWKTKWGYELRAVGENPSGGGIRRNLAAKADNYCDDDFGRLGGNGRDRRSNGLSLPLLRRIFRRLGISRNRGCTFGQKSSARHISSRRFSLPS